VTALFQHLRLPLADPPRPLLFSAHIGDGKTTLLQQLRGQLEREEHDFVAFGEADERLDLSDIEYDDVLLSILAIVDQSLRQRYQEAMEADAIQRFWHELSRMANLPIQLDKAELSLGPFGKLTAIIRDSPNARLQVRQRLREAREATFLSVVNGYLHEAQQIVRRYGHRQLVVILDNLDRLPGIQGAGQVFPDERLLLGQATHLLGIQYHVIYAVRLALVRAQGANLMDRYGHQSLVVPMIPVHHPDNTPHEAGMAKLQEIVQRRLQAAGTDIAQAFSDTAQMVRLCRASSGHLRTLMTLMRSACAEARTAHTALPLTAADIGMAIRNIGAQARMVAADYAKELTLISTAHRLDGLPAEVRYAVFHHHLVYEYFADGNYWYDTSRLLVE
jgi:hypothetical protein